MNIAEILKAAYLKWSNEPFIYEKENNEFKSHSFKEFIENVLYLVKGLKELNLDNKKYMIYSKNSLNYLEVETAVTAYLGTIIHADKNYKIQDLESTILKTSPDVFLYSKEKENIVNELKEKYPNINYIELENLIPKIIQIGKSLSKDDEDLFNEIPNNPKKCCKIIFTSGSTSKPKAAMISGENIISGYECYSSRFKTDENTREYLYLPFSHIFGSLSFYYGLITGKKIYLSSDTKNIIEELQVVKPDYLLNVPIMCERILNYASSNGLSLKEVYGGNLNEITVGGAKTSKELKKKYRDEGIDLLEVYGMSEMASAIIGGSIENYDIDSTGTLYDKYEYRIINKNDQGIGELIIRKNDEFLGYYNDPESTNNATDEEGFYHTGDLGKIVDNKFYFERRKDRIVALPNGEKINLNELEKYIADKLKIEKITLHFNGETLSAIIYSKYDIKYDEEIRRINDLLPKYEQIDSYEIKSSNERMK